MAHLNVVTIFYLILAVAFVGLLFVAGAYLSSADYKKLLTRGVVLQELPEGVVFLDPAGRVADFNDFAENLLGLSRKLLGKPALALREFDSVADTLSSGSVSSNGLAVAPVVIAGRSIVARARRIAGNPHTRGVVLSLSDVTERVRLQDELDALRADLLRREHFSVTGRLSADIAHEISAPLDYVQAEFGSIKDLAAGSIGDEAVRAKVFGMVRDAEDSLGSIDRVVHSLLEYARRCNGNETPVPYDLTRGVQTALELSRSDYSRVAVIDLDLGETPQVLARGSEIDRVLLNILRNATAAVRERASTTGQPGRIWVKTRLEESTVVCEIGNDGRPMNETQGPAVFEEFFSGKLGSKGTALGLSISKDIVERHHAGKLALVSRAPVVFRMELPVAEVTAPSP
jgi:signal transduction histidine kinase